MSPLGALSIEEGHNSVNNMTLENRSSSLEEASLEVQEKRSLSVGPSPLEVETGSDGSTNESRKTIGVLQLAVIVFYNVSGE